MTDFISAESLNSLRDHLLPGLWPFLVAAAVCIVVVPVAIALSRRFGWIAEPGGRHAHEKPTPVLGGLAMYAGFAVALVAFLPGYPSTPGLLVVAGLAMALLAVDDRRPMNPWLKLAVQVFLAALAVIVFGMKITFVSVPGAHVFQLGLLAVPVSVFWLLGMQNTVNFLDGADGLAAGVIAIVAIVLMLAAGELGHVDDVRLSGALAGCCAGFLVFNFHPARIFMGDSGAHFLGIALGMISIVGVAKVAVAFALVIPALALGVPILDTGWAILRRRRSGVSIAHADTRHIHHQLLDFGLTQGETCLVFYGATAILGAVGLMIFGHRRVLAFAIVLVLVALSTVLGEWQERQPWRVPAPGLRRLLGAAPAEQGRA